MSDKLTASVIGAGAGGKLSMDALARSDRFDLTAVADLRPGALEEISRRYPGIRTYTDHKQMFREAPTDIVCVSTYAPSHESITLDALEMPIKGILVEKPLAATHEAGARIMDAVKRKGIPMTTPHNLLVQSASKAVINAVRGGLIGHLGLVEIECMGWDVLNAGIHWANFFVALTGNEPMATVFSAMDKSEQTVRDGLQVETAGVTYAQTVSAVRMVMQTGDYVAIPGQSDGTLFRIVGSAGQIRLVAWAEDYWIQNENYPTGQVIRPDSADTTGHQRHLENLADNIADGTADYSVSNSSLMALEICEAAYVSASHRVQVRLPLAQFIPSAVSDWQLGRPV